MMIRTSTLFILTLMLIQGCSSSNESVVEEDYTPPVESSHELFSENGPRVTGIGGIFFLSDNPTVTKEWYSKNLGMVVNEFGSPFEFRNARKPDEKNYLNWNPFEKNTDYFDPSKKEFMVNYRVQDLDGLVANLRNNGVTILDDITEYEYGRFIHIMDLDGNKIELWEPNDSFFTEMGGATTK